VTLRELRGWLIDAAEWPGERWRVGGKRLACRRRGFHRLGPVVPAAESLPGRGFPEDMPTRVCADCGTVSLDGS
jgi:hypothetical protein